jgi:hypothetical protein
MSQTKQYHYTEVREAVPFNNITKKIDTAHYLRVKTNKDSFSWNEINEVLTNKGWSVRHLLMLRDNLR